MITLNLFNVILYVFYEKKVSVINSNAFMLDNHICPDKGRCDPGTEKGGPEAAFATLYANAEVFVTADSATDPAAAAVIEAFWQAIGKIGRAHV